MKKGILACVIASVLLTSPFSFRIQRSYQQTGITGKISPAEASETALIIRNRDTLKTPVTWGIFTQLIKPGTYKLVVKAKAPFKNASVGNLEVKRNQMLNVGELMLQK